MVRPPAGGTQPATHSHSPSPAPRKLRILVVEDDAFVRGGIVRLINGQNDLACCGEADTVVATPAAVAAQKPDLALLDLRLEDGTALELISRLKKQFPQVPVLVLSHFDEKFYAPQTLQAGARGYLMKEAATEHLPEAIRMVMDGKIYLSPAMTAYLLQEA
jgi:DNA-binding NarL/FixJ family response regulator